MSGRFVSGGIHWRISGDNRQAIARLHGQALVMLGQLRDLLGDTPSGVLHRVFPDGIVRVMYADTMPIVAITVTGGGEGESSLYLVALDSGVLMFSSRQVERQPPQNSAIQPSWLGRAKIIGGSIASFDNRHAKFTPAAISQIMSRRFVSNFSGRARLLWQSLVGAANSTALALAVALCSANTSGDVGVVEDAGSYFLILIGGGEVVKCAISFPRQADPFLQAIAVAPDRAARDKAEAYAFSMASIAFSEAVTIGTYSIDGAPTAYGWNFDWSGTQATLCTREFVTSGSPKYYRMRRYRMTTYPSVSLAMPDDEQATPNGAMLTIWSPGSPGSIAPFCPLSDTSGYGNLSFNAPIYSFFDNEDTEVIVRYSSTHSAVPGVSDDYDSSFCMPGGAAFATTPATERWNISATVVGQSLDGVKYDSSGGSSVIITSMGISGVSEVPIAFLNSIEICGPRPGMPWVNDGNHAFQHYGPIRRDERTSISNGEACNHAIVIGCYDREAVVVVRSSSVDTEFDYSIADYTRGILMEYENWGTYGQKYRQSTAFNIIPDPGSIISGHTITSTKSSKIVYTSKFGQHSHSSSSADSSLDHFFANPADLMEITSPLYTQGVAGSYFMEAASTSDTDKTALYTSSGNRQSTFVGWA